MGESPGVKQSIRLLDHHDLSVAERIHAIQMAAYVQEAALLGTVSFPPLQRQVVDVQRAEGHFLGAFLDGQLGGTLSVELGSVKHEITISSLTVDPAFQRRGLGRALVAAVIREFAFRSLTVSTGARNLPALGLYAQFGFVEFGRRRVGEEQLEVVELRLNRSKCGSEGGVYGNSCE
jgi:ribosomal protein S18 acetylase RimI-like enzyme